MALNPQHNIPFYVEDGFSMNESKAILTYLADKHSDKNDKLYPKDLKTRAVVNQRLMFDTSTFIKIAGDMIVSIENSTRKICHRLYFSLFLFTGTSDLQEAAADSRAEGLTEGGPGMAQ